ncbi:hypothetical protein FisN_18Hh027 [Fistulifera solaris]|jgi:hypothetical protein|uniref:MYND-type domain-containing protein n=1 Tax=Fistulifera solaris TaxID=1519565 RepID=A0A1Z5JUW9_FISSO|nr:hypothetical protein FisN_18Hh027 [Fistulifera solaris]|eukprot:GAX17827.1 hypothetical protein FisN_18Hh027 [Fistulifera solaris]
MTTTTESSSLSTEWLQTLELGYAGVATPSFSNNKCFHCNIPLTTPKQCSQCHVATYCSKECQIQDWKQRHKKYCAAYQRIDAQGRWNTPDDDSAHARHHVLHQIRLYAMPYAVYQMQALGRGFLFIQSTQTLAALTLPGRNRSVLLHYLTLGEYDAEVCRDDFELTAVRTCLQKAVNDYDAQQQMVVLMRFRCGHVAVGIIPLSLEFAVCLQLGKEYYQNVTAGALELQLDDD